MKTMVTDIQQFHEKFNLPAVTEPGLLAPEVMMFRVNFLNEELQETIEAYAAKDLTNVADGLIDLIYVALGTLHLMNMPTQALWDEVHRANMTKERALTSDQSTRNSTQDVIKPPGWTPPECERIIKEHHAKIMGAQDAIS